MAWLRVVDDVRTRAAENEDSFGTFDLTKFAAV